MPTNISISREYIDSLKKNEELSQIKSVEDSTTGENALRTLAISEIESENITIENMSKASSMLRGEASHEHDPIK